MQSEELVEVAYVALTIACNCASVLAEKGLLSGQSADLTVGEIRRLAAMLENLHGQGPDALPTAQSVRLTAVATSIEALSRGRREGDPG